MKTEELDYHLPGELIAQQPVSVRSRSRLLVLDRSQTEFIDSRFARIGDYLSGGDCLVLNETKVLQARFFCRRSSGGKLKGLFLAEAGEGVWEVMLRGAGKVRQGEKICLRDRKNGDFCLAEVVERLGEGRCRLKLESEFGFEQILEEIGFPPVPPYIKRDDDANKARTDKLRYQTVYAREAGAVAAPTAGLHFTKKLLEELKGAGIQFAFITLHVGPGTFKPITTETVEEHQMEQEQFSISSEAVRIINAAKEEGARVVAVGTTSVRALETAAAGSRVGPVTGDTGLFIRPGYEFKVVDAMVTNFHLPKSTLLALVGAFAGVENIFAAYRHAIKQRYRFYSYGDAMLIL
ncbi:MAG: tRNA preQ1(34) S-adenosylmethionine ribosyltransferase-isomerase QueA [Planctomycetota bacterium]|jgi:S-adenosylmethionine:tRNA ribosyltransferase-isomerase